jgi:hypothetical protein
LTIPSSDEDIPTGTLGKVRCEIHFWIISIVEQNQPVGINTSTAREPREGIFSLGADT